MSTAEWLSAANTLVTGGAAVLVWLWRRTLHTEITDQDTMRRLHEAELEIERLRKWRHEVIVPWQQEFIGRVEERFVTRREWDQARENGDSPWPNNRRRNPR